MIALQSFNEEMLAQTLWRRKLADQGAMQNRTFEAELDDLALNADVEVARRLLAETKAQVRRKFDEVRDAALAEARIRMAPAHEVAT